MATLSGAVNLGERWSQDIDSIEIRTDLEPLVSRIAGRFMVGPFDDTGRFDSVLVIDRRGTEIVFAPPRAEAQVRSLEELRTGAGDVYQVDLRADPVVVRFGGNRYQLFVKPLPIRIAALAEDEEDVHADWMIVGLVSASRFRTDSIAIHYGLVAAAVLLSLFLLLAYPLLELAFMGSRDSFSRVRLARLVVSVMLGSSFGALCVVDLLAYMTVKRITDGQLEQLSTRVEAEFVKERREMESLLERLSGEAFVDRVTSSSSRHRRVDSMLQHRPWRDEALGAWGATEGKEEEEDRYFDGINTIAWMDEEGEQVAKWAARNYVTPFVNVANREYFRNVERRRSWPDGSLAATFLEPIQSMTTGETTIAFSRSVEESAVRAVAIIAPMRSVIDSVLPVYRTQFFGHRLTLRRPE